MIHLSNLAKAWGERTLFADVTQRLDPGHRYGLVGANGSGKSTLLRILAGEEPPSDGEVIMSQDLRVGVLKQDRYLSDDQRILDVAMMGDTRAWEAMAAKERLLAADEPDAAAIAAAEERLAHADGYTLESRAAAILEGLGIPEAQHHQPLSILSGGFKLRVLLTQTLVENPDLLLLDEPTNHLDILTIDWLEEFLRRYEGCAVVISHDHRFLDAIATHILDVDYETVTLYHGNYAQFLEAKAETRARMEAQLERQEKIVADKKAFVERFRAKASKARQAQSRAKQIEKIEASMEDLAQTSRRAPHFHFEQTRRSGKDVLEAHDLAKAYGDKQVLDGVDLMVKRGERVGIIGANGLGKSTLLKILVGRLEADAGEAQWGHEVHVGYFAQDHRELLEGKDVTVLDYLWEICPQEGTSFVRGQLGKMLFSGEDVEKKCKALSGGEAARLIFSRIIVQQPNVLILDEPTNHLDLETIEALVEALDSYPGTLFFVSHDRWFVDRLATRIVELRTDGIEDYPGGYTDFLARAETDHLDKDAVLAAAKAESRGDDGGGAAEDDYEAHKRRRAEHRKLERERDEVTAAIEKAEARVAAIGETFCRPGFFEDTPPDEVSALQDEEAALHQELEQLMARWEEVEMALEDFAD